MSVLTLTPAYGRDYKSKDAVLADWYADKDFIESSSGKYINQEDVSRYSPNAVIRIRYSKLRKVVIVPSEKAKPC